MGINLPSVTKGTLEATFYAGLPLVKSASCGIFQHSCARVPAQKASIQSAISHNCQRVHRGQNRLRPQVAESV